MGEQIYPIKKIHRPKTRAIFYAIAIFVTFFLDPTSANILRVLILFHFTYSILLRVNSNYVGMVDKSSEK